MKMSQKSIASYFATRKRPAADDIGVIKAKKVLILDRAETSTFSKELCEETKSTACDFIYSSKEVTLNNNEALKSTKLESSTDQEQKLPQTNKVVTKLNFDPVTTSSNTNMTIKRGGTPKSKPRKAIKEISNQPSIQSVFQNLQTTKNTKNSQEINEKTPPTTPVKNALDNIDTSKNKDLSLNEIKNKLSRSSRLAELKASIAKFNKSADKLKEIEKKTSALSKESTGPTLKTFEKIELEVQLSPKKIVSPVKQYLSPKKDASSPKKNLFELLSSSKTRGTTSTKTLPAYQRFQSLASPEKASLTLPFKYRSLAEMFRSIDTVCAMMYNRKETITFNKVKPAVQSMMRRNLTLQHFAQINTLYPDAFVYKWEKMKCFASMKETSELVIVPAVKESETESEAVMNPTCLLERRRKLFSGLIEKVKDYHEEFLQSLDPPMEIARDKITRWHPEFDIEKVPDIGETELPRQPEEEKMTTGQEVLEKARSLFSCNTRMEKALEKLRQLQEAKPAEERRLAAVVPPEPVSLKGIPKSLLEKVRAKQAAKALDAMTRSSSQDKEAVMYARLPDIARLMRNTFVAEKKGVLPLEECIIKLNNSYRSRMTNSETEEHLRLLSRVVPGWLVFHEIRRTLFVKLSRDGDMAKVMTRLEQLAKEKSGS